MKPNREMTGTTRLANSGTVVSVRGSVVDVRFDAQLPPIYSQLRAGEKNQIVIEVLAQLDAHCVRGIALTPTQGLARGMAVEDSGGPLQAPVGKGILARMFDVFGNAIDREAVPTDVQWCSVHRAPPPLAGAVVLVVVVSRCGDAYRIVSFSIYVATLFLLYLISTLYQGVRGVAPMLLVL